MAISEHARAPTTSADDSPPIGYCQCGCGRRTTLAPQNCSRTDIKKGHPRRYLRGHNRRKCLRYVVAPGGYKTDCWLWQLCKNKDGYGKVRDSLGKVGLAHRAYYEERSGAIPAHLELDHLCGVRACVNPEHLEAVTRHENLRRCGKLKLKPSDVDEIRRSTDTQRVIARRYGISQSQVSRIRAGLSWRDHRTPGLIRSAQPSSEPPGG
jgi:hypothetical protein